METLQCTTEAYIPPSYSGSVLEHQKLCNTKTKKGQTDTPTDTKTNYIQIVKLKYVRKTISRAATFYLHRAPQNEHAT